MKGKNIRRVFVAAALLLLLLCGVVGLYAADYYRADATAQAAMMDYSMASSAVYEIGEDITVFVPEDPVAGFIFYPGGKVEYTAYAPLLRMLAGENILCAVVKMPLNLAVLDIDAAAGVREKFSGIDDWYIGGHSLGGSMAASYVAKNPNDYTGLVLLASYSTEDLKETELKVVSIYGSADGVLNMEKYGQYQSNLPDNAVEYVIEGGNHAQFGSYGHQDGDGQASVTAEEQTIMTALQIVDLIRK